MAAIITADGRVCVDAVRFTDASGAALLLASRESVRSGGEDTATLNGITYRPGAGFTLEPLGARVRFGDYIGRMMGSAEPCVVRVEDVRSVVADDVPTFTPPTAAECTAFPEPTAEQIVQAGVDLGLVDAIRLEVVPGMERVVGVLQQPEATPVVDAEQPAPVKPRQRKARDKPQA